MTSTSPLDYFGIRPDCGCITAWMAGDDVTDAEVREFYRDMADSGREVRRMPLTEELRQKIARCPHLPPVAEEVRVSPVPYPGGER